MTTRINLLPWREERRKQLQQEFLGMLVLAALLGGAVVFGLYRYAESNLDAQQTRNAYINKQLGMLDNQIKEIKALEDERSELVERMKVIQDLQGNRPSIVYVFDQLVRTLPDGVYYTEVKRQGAKFTITGYAESNNRISRLMRNLHDSAWFQEPTLQNVTTVDDKKDSNKFVLTVNQASPQDDTKKGGDKS